MNKYWIFFHGPKDPKWSIDSVLSLFAVSDDKVKTEFAHAHAIYREEEDGDLTKIYSKKENEPSVAQS